MSAVATRDRVSVAREALLEITRASDVGELISDTVDDDGVATLLFAATMLGYPGWHWTVSVVTLDGEEPSVLEAELLPGDGALLAPDWVPWSERLEEWKEQQAAEAAAAGSDDDEADDDDSDDEDDESDEDSDDEDSDDEDDFDDDEHDDLGDDVYDGLDPEAAAEHGSEGDADEDDLDDDEGDHLDDDEGLREP